MPLVNERTVILKRRMIDYFAAAVKRLLTGLLREFICFASVRIARPGVDVVLYGCDESRISAIHYGNAACCNVAIDAGKISLTLSSS